MTTKQFIRMLNENYGNKTEWPKELVVDAETYANCCQHVINEKTREIDWYGFFRSVRIVIGDHNGILFKGVELILKT